jgi:hypothetical protein
MAAADPARTSNSNPCESSTISSTTSITASSTASTVPERPMPVQTDRSINPTFLVPAERGDVIDVAADSEDHDDTAEDSGDDGDDAGDDGGDGGDGDLRLTRAHQWSIANGGQAGRRVATVRKLIDLGLMDLHPEHLGFLRYVLNWDDVTKQLPRLGKGGRRLDRGAAQRMGEYRIFCLDLLMPTVVLLQQVMNYRVKLGRSLPVFPDARRPVSAGVGMSAGDREYVTMQHVYTDDGGLQSTLRDAHIQLREYRTSKHGWAPLRDLILRDGVEDGGLWLQTVYAPLGADGQPELARAHASLAPADAASRKAVCDDTVDPAGLLAALPLLAPRRRDVYGPDTPSPSEPVDVAAAVGSVLGRVKTALSQSGAEFADELDDETLALLNATVMPVRLVYRVEDGRGRPVTLTAPALFREIQGHFHGLDHLGHPETETERLQADKVREALREAINAGVFTDRGDGCNSAGQPLAVAWTGELLDVLSYGGDYTALTTLGLPADRLGAAVAGAMLTYGAGPERAIIGKALGSQRNGGAWDNELRDRRQALLRELVFADRSDVNRRAFERVDTQTLWQHPPTGWDGDTDTLVDAVAAGTADPVQSALFDMLAVVCAAEYGMALVDLGSAGTARGFASTKARNAVCGVDVKVDKDNGIIRRYRHPAGLGTVKALLGRRLLTELPTPVTVDGVVLDAPTMAQWTAWAAGGVGALDDAGQPLLVSQPATVLTDDGHLQVVDDKVVRQVVDVPVLVPATVLDTFAKQRLTARAIEQYQAGGGGTAQPRPALPYELVDDALGAAATALAQLDSAVSVIETQTGGGYVLDDKQVSALMQVSLAVRKLNRSRGVGERLDVIAEQNEQRQAGLAVDDHDGDGDHDGLDDVDVADELDDVAPDAGSAASVLEGQSR